ncbi:MAG: DUF3019 domain-containing protein [Pseudomonadota bacterium]
MIVTIAFVCCGQTLRADTAETPTLLLTVTPSLCIVDRQTPVCDAQFLLQWESGEPGGFCLYVERSREAVRCWRDVNIGELSDERSVVETFEYWMTEESDDVRLANATVEVLRLDNGDRRRRRRNRRVWDLL